MGKIIYKCQNKQTNKPKKFKPEIVTSLTRGYLDKHCRGNFQQWRLSCSLREQKNGSGTSNNKRKKHIQC